LPFLEPQSGPEMIKNDTRKRMQKKQRKKDPTETPLSCTPGLAGERKAQF
jgi:hypothetical protein